MEMWAMLIVAGILADCWDSIRSITRLGWAAIATGFFFALLLSRAFFACATSAAANTARPPTKAGAA
jgi:hypothetical protein